MIDQSHNRLDGQISALVSGSALVATNPPQKLHLAPSLEAGLIAGARNYDPVGGLTHSFYKYPARFSPSFARAAIEAFSQPGEWVFDNHVGGGTTLVEALALGRNGLGVDISSLAEFVSTVKTTVLSPKDIETLEHWITRLPGVLNIKGPTLYLANYDDLGYYKHLNHASRWRLRKAIEQGIWASISLSDPRLEAFGRCAVLKTAQWALDGRKSLPSFGAFRAMLVATAEEMLCGAKEFQEAVGRGSDDLSVRVLHRSAAGLENDPHAISTPAPSLILTSPPYPGIHVLYHRWQVDGRKEAPLPFMIANKLDGAGGSFYTMGDRKYPGLLTYFENIKAAMGSVVQLANADTTIVQMVAFSEPSWQLPTYLATMDEIGLTEAYLPSLEGDGDGRLWRSVPNRRWYSQQRGMTAGSQEVVLLHRKTKSATPQQLLVHQPRRLETNPPDREKLAQA